MADDEEIIQEMEQLHIEERVIQTSLGGEVGFDSIPQQINRKALKRGFQFNILVAGASGLGKSTFVNTLFTAHLLDSKFPQSSANLRQTTDIETVTHLIEENGVKLTLSITDTPGFGDQINNENAWEPIVLYITDQYYRYSRDESAAERPTHIRDTRVNVVLYFIAPSGHGLKPLDIEAMKAISKVANLIPVIAKSDALTIEERRAFKKRIQDELAQNEISVYPNASGDYDDQERAANQQLLSYVPFAVSGCEKSIVVDGKPVRGRRFGWGIVDIDNPEHCDFTPLRNCLIRTHMQDLIDTTRFHHYEQYRTQAFNAKKDKKEKKKAGTVSKRA